MTRLKLNGPEFSAKNRGPVAGAAWMVAAGAGFAIVNTAVQGATMLRGAAPEAVVFWQYLIALALCVPLMNVRRALRVGRWPWHLLRVGLGAVGVQFWVHGLAYVPIWQAIALILLSPFLVTLGAALFLGERVTFARWLAVLLGMAGGALVLAPWEEAFTLAAVYPVLAALFWAASSLVTKWLALEEDAAVLTLWLLALLVPVNFGLAVGAPLAAVPWGLVVLAGIGTGFAQFALASAYRSADAAYVQPFDHVKLPLNIALGFAVFGFAPEGWIWGGVAMIFAAGLWLMWLETQVAPVPPRRQGAAAS